MNEWNSALRCNNNNDDNNNNDSDNNDDNNDDSSLLSSLLSLSSMKLVTTSMIIILPTSQSVILSLDARNLCGAWFREIESIVLLLRPFLWHTSIDRTQFIKQLRNRRDQRPHETTQAHSSASAFQSVHLSICLLVYLSDCLNVSVCVLTHSVSTNMDCCILR